MSIWQACDAPQAQTPDSLTASPVAQESAAQSPSVADTVHAHAATAPVPQASSQIAHHSTRMPAPQAPDSVASAATQPADSLVATIPLSLPQQPRDTCRTAQLDSLCRAWTHFQMPSGGYFEGNPYWHPECPALYQGMPCTPVPYRVSTDSPTACAVLVCLVMLVYMLLRYGGEMRSQMHDFFLPARIRQGHRQGLSTAQGLLSMPYVCLMLSVMGSIGVSVAQQDRLALLPDAASRLALQAFYGAVWLAFFFLKANSYAFINWIFFDKHARREWHDTQFHVQALESVLLFPVLLIMVYMHPPMQVFVWSVLGVIALAKVLLLYKAQSLFFAKIHCALHLIVYFCTLEVAPLWVILKLLTHITDLLQVN